MIYLISFLIPLVDSFENVRAPTHGRNRSYRWKGLDGGRDGIGGNWRGGRGCGCSLHLCRRCRGRCRGRRQVGPNHRLAAGQPKRSGKCGKNPPTRERHQNPSFHARNAANAAMRSPWATPRAASPARSPGWSTRRKGLQARSLDIVLGTVGKPRDRRSATWARR